MNDMELAEEIERGELVIAAANSQHRYVPLEIKDQIIAALRGRPEHDKEIGEFQQSVYAICEKFYPEVDGAGSDTGDWRDFTLAEIRQTLNHLAERPPSGEMVMVPRWSPAKLTIEKIVALRTSREWGLNFDVIANNPHFRTQTSGRAICSCCDNAFTEIADLVPSYQVCRGCFDESTRMLAAAEAEGRKPCPLCGRKEPHSHTSGPLGIS